MLVLPKNVTFCVYRLILTLKGVFHLSNFLLEHHFLLLKLFSAEFGLIKNILNLVELSTEIIALVLKFAIHTLSQFLHKADICVNEIGLLYIKKPPI